MTRPRLAISLLLAATLLAGCAPAGGTSGGPTGSPASGGRPSSPAVLTITEPTNGEVITGDTLHVVVSLKNATVVKETTTHIVPTEGHVHLYLDGALIYMQYGLEQDLGVKPGTYTLRAEFVASDHAPFAPRVTSPQIIFTVK